LEEIEINITDLIVQTLNTLFQNLFSSIDNSLYFVLDDMVFIDSSVISDSYFEKLLGTSSSNGILLIVNSLLIGFLLYYCINLFVSNFTLTQVQRPYQFLFKFALIIIFINSSYFLCEKIISFNSILSLSIRNIGETIFNKNICFSSLITEINSILYIENPSFDIFSLDGIIKSLSSVSLFNLIFSYSLRYIMIKVFILLSPFAILSFLLPSTSWFFKTWLQGFLSLLFIQILISIILLIIFSLCLSENIFSKFMYVGSLYALLRANTYVKELIGGISTEVQSNFSNFNFSGK